MENLNWLIGALAAYVGLYVLIGVLALLLIVAMAIIFIVQHNKKKYHTIRELVDLGKKGK